MNKQILQPSRNFLTRLGIPVALVLITITVLILASWKSIQSTTPVQAVTVVMRDVETELPLNANDDTALVIQAPGWVEAEPYSVYAGSLTEGIVEEIFVLEGDSVTKGQTVATLVSDDNKLALQAAIANHNLKLAQLKESDASLQTLADEYNRKRTLVESGAVAAGPVERLRLQLLAEESKIAIAQAAAHASQIEVDTAQLALTRCTIVSPIDGVVIERLMSPGSVIRFGGGEHASHVVHLYDPTQLQVRADVPLADASNVGVGHPAKIIVDVLPNTSFDGEVLRFVHRADQQKNTVEAKVKIHNPSQLLKPDMLARVKILQPTKKDGTQMSTEQHVFVPKKSISDLKNPTLWIVTDLVSGVGTATKKSITLGTQEFDGWIEVLSGLNAGAKVITTDGPFVENELVEIKDGE